MPEKPPNYHGPYVCKTPGMPEPRFGQIEDFVRSLEYHGYTISEEDVIRAFDARGSKKGFFKTLL